MAKGEAGFPAFPILRRYGQRHVRWLMRGLFGTLFVVAFRLAMPWPLRAVIESAFPGEAGRAGDLVASAPDGIDHVLWFCGLYVVLALGTGLAEMFQRTCMTTFAVGAVRDLQDAALRDAAGFRRETQPLAQADLISRLTGDAARLKEALNGILVHASQNGLLFLAICALFLAWSPHMALFFLGGGLIAVFIGYAAAGPVERAADKQRTRESAYHATVQNALEHGTLALGDDDDDEGGSDRDGSVKVVSLSTLAIHLLLGLTVAAALFVGVQQVQAGSLAPGELFLFVVYALTVHRRLVQLGRQLARTGKVRACVARIAPLLDDFSRASAAASSLGPLRSGLRLEDVSVGGLGRDGRKRRIKDLSLTIPAGSKVAVLGRAGAGKSSLLASLAGLDAPSRGTIYWDDHALNGARPRSVAYLPQEPVFLPKKAWQLLGLDHAEALTPSEQELLQRLGAWKAIRKLPKGLATPVSSATLSEGQGRALGLGMIALGEASLWLLDTPLEGMTRKAALRRLDALLERAGTRTMVASLSRLQAPERFDRVVVLHKGRVRFDGTPAEWGAWKSGRALGELPCKP